MPNPPLPVLTAPGINRGDTEPPRWAWRRACSGMLAILTLALTGCAVAPSHPGLQPAKALPPLLPVRSYVADLDASGGHQLSPDGRRLLWSARIGLGPGLFVQDLDTGKTRSMPVRGLGIWTRDSQRVLLHLDNRGDENTHLVALDLSVDPPRLTDLTPFAGAQSQLLMQLDDSADLLVLSNRRDPKVFDLYRHVQATGDLQLVARNPGDVALWLPDRQGRLLGRARLQDGRWQVETPDGVDGAWRARFQVDPLQTLQPLRLSADGSHFWALSNRHSDTLALVKLWLDGREEQVHADPRVDISEVVFSPRRHVPLAVALDPDLQTWQAIDPAFAGTLDTLRGAGPSRLHIASISDDEQALVAALLHTDGGRVLLHRQPGHSLQTLAELPRSRWQAHGPLPATQALQFKSRDGLNLHGYLTLPAGTPASTLAGPVPAVVYVHGGPWARDLHLGGDAMVDFLANRGYAVLQVNYRGSTGYGRRFRDAAQGEFAGAMQADLLDGLDHVVQRGLVDPRRVAILGASYGGYASLVGMTFPPQRFACGISIVGMSDLASLLEQAPPYWELGRPLWHRFVGDPADPAQRAAMRQRSPLWRAADAAGPILLMHGAHDPRVKVDQSQRMAQALRQAGKPVDLQVFDQAGHGFHRWQDRLRQFRLTEDFLAPCLGGRSGGFDLFEVGAWLF